jgi:prevent-host-death family protein
MFGTIRRMDEQPIAEARANLSDLISRVRLLRTPVCLTRRGKPQAAVVPVELAEAAQAVGGPDKAAELLRGLR